MTDDLDDVWDDIADAEPPSDDEDEPQGVVDIGPPVRLTFVIESDRIPVAPWAQGWRVGALGPDEDGYVTIVAEHDIEISPVAQLAAVTGMLGTIKQAGLELVWWAIQARGPLPGEPRETDDVDRELQELLEDAPASHAGDEDIREDLDALDS